MPDIIYECPVKVNVHALSREFLKGSFYVSFRPPPTSDLHGPTKKTSPDFPPLRLPPSDLMVDLEPILYRFLHFRANLPPIYRASPPKIIKNLYRIGPRSTIRSEGGGQKAERGKVSGNFFGRTADGGGRGPMKRDVKTSL